eukprot:UN11572
MIKIKDLNDCQRHFEVLYGYIVRLENEIVKLKQNKCMNMGTVDDEKMNANGDILSVNELNQKIQKLTESNVQLQKQLLQEHEKNKPQPGIW